MKRAAILLLFALPAFAAEPSKFTLPVVSALNLPGTAGATVTVAASDSLHPGKADVVCTGTADQVCIQSAIDSLPTTGGRVLLLEGTYHTTAEIYSVYGLWLQGHGPGTIIQAASGIDRAIVYILNRTGGSYRGATAGNNVTISDMTLDGGGLSGIYHVYAQGYTAAVLNPRVLRINAKNSIGSSYGVLTSAAVSDLLVSDSSFEGISDSAIEIRKASRAVISGNTFNGGAGIQVYSSVETYGVNIVGNTFVDAAALRFSNDGGLSRGVTFTGNSMHRIASDCDLEIRNATDVTVSGNFFSSSAQTGTSSAPLVLFPAPTGAEVAPSRVIFSNNVLSVGAISAGATSYPAISIESGDSVSVIGNIIQSSGTTTSTGLLVSGAVTGLSVRGNRIGGAGAGASRVGVSLASTTGAVVEGNDFYSLSTGVVVAASSTGTRVAENAYSSVSTTSTNADTTSVIASSAPGGSVGNPGLALYDGVSVGGLSFASHEFSYEDDANKYLTLRYAAIRLRSDSEILFSVSINSMGTPDTGLARAAAGVVKVTDGSTGIGKLLNARAVTPDIDGETTTAVQSGTVWTNTGDGDGEAITLLNDPGIGVQYCFAVDVAQTITVAPSTGETLYYGTDQCVASLTSNAIGSTLCVTAITGGSGAKWFTMSAIGTWTCND